MFEICGQMSDLPPSCEIHLTKFKQCINGDIDDFFNKIDVDQTIGHLQAFIKLLDLNDHQRKELNELVNDMETIAYKLMVNIMHISVHSFRFVCSMISLIFVLKLKA